MVVPRLWAASAAIGVGCVRHAMPDGSDSAAELLQRGLHAGQAADALEYAYLWMQLGGK